MINRKQTGKRPVERQTIVDAAARLFRTKGYHATSMADIGAAVGRLGGSLYYHVESKEGLLYEIVEVATRDLLAGVRDLSRAPTSPAERLRAAIISHLRLCVARSDYAVVFLNEIQNLRDIHRRHTLLQLVKHYEDFFCHVIEDGMIAGEFRKGLDVKVTAYAILGMGNWALRWFRPDGRLSIERIAAGFADLVIEGLRR
jgi:AcrR family transcriptional regulator